MSICRQLQSRRSRLAAETMNDEAWQEISTEFSPVYECGALNMLTSTSSNTLDEASSITPNLMV